MSSYIIDAAGYLTGVYDGPGALAGSTRTAPPEGAAHPLRFLGGAWLMPAAAGRLMSHLAFFSRFEMLEWLAIENAKPFDPMVAYIMFMANAGKYIDLDDERLLQGMGYLVQKSILTTERAAAILGAPITADELP